MKRFWKKWVAAILAGSLVLTLCACGGNGNTAAEEASTANNEKIDIVLMIENADEPAGTAIIEKIKEHFPEYNIVSKLWDGNVEQTVKSTFATDGEAIDLVMYNGSLATFVDSDMAIDLTPYFDANPELKASFVDGALENGQCYIDGKIYGAPYSCVYPMLEVNTKVLEDAGVEYKDAWTWDEFLDACQKIKENTDAFPVGCLSDWATWFGIQAMIQAISDPDEYALQCAGKVPFSDERVITNMDKVVALYDAGYMYPGEGALTITGEEVDTGFANGKIAMRCDVNSVSKGFVDALDIADQVKIMSWPTMAEGGPGSEGDRVLGGNNVYFIPSNTKHPDAAFEIMKYVFGEEIQTLQAQAGTIICTNVDTGVDLSEWSKDMKKVTPDLVYLHSPELSTYINSDFFTSYFFDKEATIETMDEYFAELAAQ